jgi:NAD(P)-dependent dehydrogenase (short-subunit alcohol dehydrogenase family)
MKLRSGDVAVVTGAASGIGYALSASFARRGLSVVMSDVRPDVLKSSAAALTALGAQVHTVVTDVRHDDEVAALAEQTLQAFGRVDVVCNNAGVAPDPAPMWEVPLEAWRWTLDVALMGVVHGIRAFAPLFIAQNRGYVVNTASVGGLTPLPSLGPYNAAKHAVVGLSESLRLEFQQAGADVGVSVLCPGLVDTDLPSSSRRNRPDALGAPSTPEPGSMTAAVAPGRAIMSAEDVAEQTMQAIEADRLHIITHADSRPRILARVDSVLADLAEDTG